MNERIAYKTLVGSSLVSGYNYVASSKKLYIRFKNDREYVYFDVSGEEFKSLFVEGSSFGKELNKLKLKKKFEEIW